MALIDRRMKDEGEWVWGADDDVLWRYFCDRRLSIAVGSADVIRQQRDVKGDKMTSAMTRMNKATMKCVTECTKASSDKTSSSILWFWLLEQFAVELAGKKGSTC